MHHKNTLIQIKYGAINMHEAIDFECNNHRKSGLEQSGGDFTTPNLRHKNS